VTHGYEPTREAAVVAFAKSWRTQAPKSRSGCGRPRNVPYCILIASHPVEYGEAKSMARPGRNITGFPAFEFSMGGSF
jgi:hypothetical protein